MEVDIEQKLGWTRYSDFREGNFFLLSGNLALLRTVHMYTGKPTLVLEDVKNGKQYFINPKKESDFLSINLEPSRLGIEPHDRLKLFHNNDLILIDISNFEVTNYEDEPPNTVTYNKRGFEVIDRETKAKLAEQRYVPEENIYFGIQYVHELQNIYEDYFPEMKDELDKLIISSLS